MQTLKISLLVFILSISLSGQEIGIVYSPLCEDKKVLIVEAYETIVEVKCYEEKSDTGIIIILLNTIRNFSNQDLIWEPIKSEIYNGKEQFKPVGCQTIPNITNVDNSSPKILNLQPIKEIEVKSKSSLSILVLFSKWKDEDRYETLLDDADADIIVGNPRLKSKQKEEIVFNMMYFKKEH